MAHLCGTTVCAYYIRDRRELPKGAEFGWDDDTLRNSIDYCEGLIEGGLARDPIDDFDLRDFIHWAETEISDGRLRHE